MLFRAALLLPVALAAPSSYTCNVGFDGNAIAVSQFQVLSPAREGCTAEWLKSPSSKVVGVPESKGKAGVCRAVFSAASKPLFFDGKEHDATPSADGETYVGKMVRRRRFAPASCKGPCARRAQQLPSPCPPALSPSPRALPPQDPSDGYCYFATRAGIEVRASPRISASALCIIVLRRRPPSPRRLPPPPRASPPCPSRPTPRRTSSSPIAAPLAGRRSPRSGRTSSRSVPTKCSFARPSTPQTRGRWGACGTRRETRREMRR
eukprot:1541117-Prymnesium_polylepis.1